MPRRMITPFSTRLLAAPGASSLLPPIMKMTRHLSIVAALAVVTLNLSAPTPAEAQDTLEHSIAAPPVGAQTGAELGQSVAVDGNYTVVGAPSDDIGGINSGVV